MQLPREIVAKPSHRAVYPETVLSEEQRLIRGTDIGMQQKVQVYRLEQDCFLHDSIKFPVAERQ
jgi:hypothetical protein